VHIVLIFMFQNLMYFIRKNNDNVTALAGHRRNEMSGGREWAAEHWDEWQEKKIQRNNDLTDALKRLSKEELELIAYAIERDTQKQNYDRYKKWAKGKKVPTNLKKLGCQPSDIRDFLQYKHVLRS